VIDAKFPQYTEGYACRFEELVASNRAAAIAAGGCLLFGGAIRNALARHPELTMSPDDLDPGVRRGMALLMYEGRVVIAKVGGVVTVLPDLTETPGSGRTFFDLSMKAGRKE